MCWVFTLKQTKHRFKYFPRFLIYRHESITVHDFYKILEDYDKEKEKVPEHLVIAHMPDTPPSPLCWLALVSSLLSHVDEDQ